MIAPIVATTIELMSNAAVDRLAVEQDAGEEAADERADDAEDDVSDDTEALVTLDEEPGEIPGDRAEDDPRDDAHSKPPSHVRASHPPAGVVWCIPKSGIRSPMSPRRSHGQDNVRRAARNNGISARRRSGIDLQSICDAPAAPARAWAGCAAVDAPLLNSLGVSAESEDPYRCSITRCRRYPRRG